ncbi:MAG: lipopolysaccharide heptosyltransferase II [Candidatus Riflebacteria bacterium]|nr:lipopolysaccharide heptosyltransferase II [Candidatus Riflebacteria bacterium]
MNKILVIGLNWIGDVVMSFPALMSLQKVDVLTRPHLTPLYSLCPAVNNVFQIDWGNFRNIKLSEIRKIQKHNYSNILIFPSSFRAAILAFLIGRKNRTGFSGELRNILLTHAIDKPADFRKMHESELYKSLAHSVISQEDKFLQSAEPSVIKHAKTLSVSSDTQLPKHLENVQKEYIVIAPGAAFGAAKRWAPAKFAELALNLYKATGKQIITTGSNAEKQITSEVLSEIRKEYPGETSACIDLGGKTSLPELINLLLNASLLICNDSGTMHLGAVTGIPMVVAVGSTDMIRTGPLSENAIIVQGDSCSPPCRKKVCQRGDSHCMNSISADAMFKASQEALTYGKC